MGYELPTQPARPLRSSDVEQTRGPQGSHDGIDNPAFPLTCVGMRGQQGPESRSHGYRVLNVGVGNKRIFQWWNIHGHPFTSVIMTIVYIMKLSSFLLHVQPELLAARIRWLKRGRHILQACTL